jgi:hypothetical protein
MKVAGTGPAGLRDPAIRTFADFWPFYVSQHRRPATRLLHFVGTTLGLMFLIRAVSTGNAMFVMSGLAAAYGFAWAGHYFIEKNRPATFTYPVWSLAGDFKMYGLMLLGRMAVEVERLGYASA